jgi:hypothetical protein
MRESSHGSALESNRRKPQSAWNSKHLHAQNTLSQPAPDPRPDSPPTQTTHQHKPRKKRARSLRSLAVCRWQTLTRSGKIKNTKGQAPLDTPKARMRSFLALIIRWKNIVSRTRDPSAYNSRWSYITLSLYIIFPVFTGEMSVLV